MIDTYSQGSAFFDRKNASSAIVMGIVNVTPDSFYNQSRVQNEYLALTQTEKMLSEGASIIDIGGYSTRPGANFVSSDEELNRVSACIETILKRFPNTTLSLDTFRGEVASKILLNYPVKIINDISGGSDKKMLEALEQHNPVYILTHAQGGIEGFHNKTNYENIISEMIDFFQKKIHILHGIGIRDIIVDPGFGFSKTTLQNFEVMCKLSYFGLLNCPILVGISRKSLIYKTLNITPNESLNGTTALHMYALMNGAHILRVHDVAAAVQTIKLFNQIGVHN
jgi:dihydropteroate synthase